MKILVIGGSGFIGSVLVRALLAEGHDVTIYDKRPSTVYPDRVVLGDVLDLPELQQAMTGADAVFNLAAEHRDDVRPVSLYYDVNVQGARNTVAAAAVNGVKRVFFTSSVAVYGLNHSEPPDEQSRPAPFNDYGRSKLEAEGVFRAWGSATDDRTLVIYRPVVVFGEGNRGNVFNLIKQIRDGRFLMVGLGNNRKSMAYVENLVGFMLWSLALNPGCHLFNYADKPDLSVRELVAHIKRCLGIPSSRLHLPYGFGLAGGFVADLFARLTGRTFPISAVRIRKFCADTRVATHALERTGYRPPLTLQDGLSRMIASFE